MIKSYGYPIKINMYQGIDGKIYIQVSAISATALELNQIKELNIDLNLLEDFNQDSFNTAYNI